ncbi:MAG: phenylalanine--tRNA ligase subunit alpha [Bacteroidales bacterium]|nr:phenylalanine--tRNA ligase subunit alpha [Bacteroidales bacterium]MCF8402511.1 phenylalanine--tRNA ligase subunit alpha [Bacteroidales bacterium]
MKEKVDAHIKEIKEFVASSVEEVEAFRLKFLSKKGIVPGLFGEMKNVAPEQRKAAGQVLNHLKNLAQEKFDSLKNSVESKDTSKDKTLDLTLPADFIKTGSRHPISIVRNDIINIFSRIGFTVYQGPEIEDDWHNFSALNFPPEHPARDMQDTFFIDKDPDIALRTHTSSVQIRMMEKVKPPIRSIFPGRVFRNEAISARAHCIFHQVEGLYIDENVSFADLKQTLYYFAQELFGTDTKIRLRPSYFPFTEPSAEMDISCFICGGKGCKVCKHTGWVEILGCGMVDPNVLANCNIDPEKYTGFAFGMGIERTTMLKYQINDIRLFFENDVRFLKQFEGAI